MVAILYCNHITFLLPGSGSEVAQGKTQVPEVCVGCVLGTLTGSKIVGYFQLFQQKILDPRFPRVKHWHIQASTLDYVGFNNCFWEPPTLIDRSRDAPVQYWHSPQVEPILFLHICRSARGSGWPTRKTSKTWDLWNFSQHPTIEEGLIGGTPHTHTNIYIYTHTDGCIRISQGVESSERLDAQSQRPSQGRLNSRPPPSMTTTAIVKMAATSQVPQLVLLTGPLVKHKPLA